MQMHFTQLQRPISYKIGIYSTVHNLLLTASIYCSETYISVSHTSVIKTLQASKIAQKVTCI
jgi:hypothetical protein